MPVGALAQALAAQILVVAQYEVNDAPFAAVHRIELERNASFANFFGGRSRAHAQLFDTQQPVIIGVEANAGMLVARHPQHFHRDLLERQHRLGFVGEKPFHIAAGKSNQKIRRLEILMRSLAGYDLELHIETGKGQNTIEKTFDLRAGFGNAVFGFAHAIASFLKMVPLSRRSPQEQAPWSVDSSPTAERFQLSYQ